MKSKLLGELFRWFEVANEIDTVDLDDQPLEGRMIRNLPAQIAHRFRVLKECDRQIDGNFDVAMLADEVAPVVECTANYEFGQRAEVGPPSSGMKYAGGRSPQVG